MRGYTVAATAVALGLPVKWVDNALSHHPVKGVSRSRQGVSRKLSPAAVITLAITVRLVRLLPIPLSRALDLARQAMESPDNPAPLHLSQVITISIDATAIARQTAEDLALAVEIAPTPRRGRPPARNKKKGAFRRPSKVKLA